MGTLFIVSTPIGNLGDITKRALETLSSVDMIACEDTRRAGQLFSHLGIAPPPFVRYDDRTERTAVPALIAALSDGKTIALISDAGTPNLSDPGFVLVRECRKRNVPVVSIPGASALLAALVSSGLPADKFMFLGYPPEKQSHRKALLQNLISMNRLTAMTYIFYCAPHKLGLLLDDIHDVLGDIDIVTEREMTKVHEEHWAGSVLQAKQAFRDPKGEFVLLFRIDIR